MKPPTAQPQCTNQLYLYRNLANPNTILNPCAIPMQSRNPSIIQAEEIAKGYKELEIGLESVANP